MKNKSQELDKIIKKANLFYKLVKKAVPLDDVVITPQSEYYDPTATETSVRRSKKREMDLPSIAEFRSHYENTNIKYRIIYCENKFNLQQIPIRIQAFKNLIKKEIESAKQDYSREESKLENANNSSEILQNMQEYEEIIKEGEFLLQEGTLNPEAINIIANKYAYTDLVGPKGVDHDLGHQILDAFEKHFQRGFSEEIKQDYHLKITNTITKEITYEDIPEVGINVIGFHLITYIIAKNNLLQESISSINLNKDTLEDLLADLLIYYNRGGETLDNIKINGVNLYTDMSFLDLKTKPFKSENKNICICPKNIDNSIPNIEGQLRNLLKIMEEKIKKVLNSRVGKVFCLWN